MMRSLKQTLCAGLLMLGAWLAAGSPAQAQGPTGLCSFIYNATTGGWNCENVGNGTNTTPLPTFSGAYASAGAQQNNLAISTNTQLTVPASARCAYITVETANVRRTSDGTSASAANGTLFASGTQWSDCGPLAAYKFTAVSGSPTLTVEYFK